jgi:ATP-dependent DNA helicase PIF1
MKEPLILDQTFQDILHQLENSRDHYFVTGRAGTGKSTLLQVYKKTTHKKVVVLSPTGISALNVQGQTIHSFFQLAPKLLTNIDIHINNRLSRLLSSVEVIIIDEISMVRADVLDAVDLSLKLHRKSGLPFGGVQMLFFGDLFQLPPVLSTPEEKEYFRTSYTSQYFFDAHCLKAVGNLQMIELTKVYRQSERHFIRLLDELRTMQTDYDTLDDLNERYLPDEVIQEPFLTLCSTNAAAQKINADRLAEIHNPSFYYSAEVSGLFSEKLFPTDYKIELRRDAQVILLRNDPEKKFVNGTLAVIQELTEESITVKIEKDDGQVEVIELPRMIWEVHKYTFEAGSDPIKSEVIGSFKQYPIRLAWAVTIHKSQGQTYDRVAVDLGRGAFEHGQAYVALSRCKTLGGLFLKKPLKPSDIMVDERIVEFYEMMR